MILALRCRGPSAGPLYATNTPKNPQAAADTDGHGCPNTPKCSLVAPDCACCSGTSNLRALFA